VEAFCRGSARLGRDGVNGRRHDAVGVD
jgi:hypothetical protein